MNELDEALDDTQLEDVTGGLAPKDSAWGRKLSICDQSDHLDPA